jgi:hypothetical protein
MPHLGVLGGLTQALAKPETLQRTACVQMEARSSWTEGGARFDPRHRQSKAQTIYTNRPVFVLWLRNSGSLW